MTKLLFPELKGVYIVEARILKRNPKMLTAMFNLGRFKSYGYEWSSELFAGATERYDKEVHIIRDALSDELAPGDHYFLAVAEHFIGNSCVYRGSKRYQMMRPKNFMRAFKGPSISYCPPSPNCWLDSRALQLVGAQTAQGWVFPEQVSVLAQRLVDTLESSTVSVEIEAQSEIRLLSGPVTFMGYPVVQARVGLDEPGVYVYPGVSVTAGTLRPAKWRQPKKVEQGSRFRLEVPKALLALYNENLESRWKVVGCT